MTITGETKPKEEGGKVKTLKNADQRYPFGRRTHHLSERESNALPLLEDSRTKRIGAKRAVKDRTCKLKKNLLAEYEAPHKRGRGNHCQTLVREENGGFGFA